MPNRDTDMEFDEWSAMEEPTFMLPEVWLRVTGIPSDVRNDYIALWAIGSLFGKTMEVDMAFTRKTKILRLRIGCMDVSVIPDTSDVYISRGFFRLAFEVEKNSSNAEIDMDDDPHNDGNNNGGDGANEEDRGNANSKDEVTNMEVEQTMNPGANQGQPSENRNNTNFKQNSLMVSFGTFPPSPIRDDVSLPYIFAAQDGSGLPVEMTEKNLNKNEAHNDFTHQFPSQPQKDRIDTVFQGDLMLDHVPMIGLRECSSADEPGQPSAVRVAAWPAAESTGSALELARDCPPVSNQVDAGSQSAANTRSLGEAPNAGSAVAKAAVLGAGSSVLHNGAVNHVSELDDKLNGAADGRVTLENDEIGMVLDGADTVSQTKDVHRPTEEEVIAFGGIAPTMARSSARLQGKENADAEVMDKAMKLAQQRMESMVTGYPYGCLLGATVGVTPSSGPAGIYGYWMQPSPDGRSGYLVPGWMVSH